jgi:hypothetical protein
LPIFESNRDFFYKNPLKISPDSAKNITIDVRHGQGNKNKMINNDYIPSRDTELDLWLDNFVKQCETYETELGLDTETFGAISILTTAFQSSLGDVVTAKEELKGLVSTKEENRVDVLAVVRNYARQWKNDPTISSNILNALGIVATRSYGPVTMVTNLIASGCGDGDNKLSWNRNGNSPDTTFVIEARINGTSTWFFAGTTTKSKFTHSGQTPGQAIWYRVISSRGNTNAGPTQPVLLFGNPGDSSLSIAA